MSNRNRFWLSYLKRYWCQSGMRDHKISGRLKVWACTTGMTCSQDQMSGRVWAMCGCSNWSNLQILPSPGPTSRKSQSPGSKYVIDKTQVTCFRLSSSSNGVTTRLCHRTLWVPIDGLLWCSLIVPFAHCLSPGGTQNSLPDDSFGKVKKLILPSNPVVPSSLLIPCITLYFYYLQ